MGSLTPGKRADLVLLDLAAAELGPAGDVASRVVYTTETDHVRGVFLGGQEIVRDGERLDMDVARLREQGRQQLEQLLSRADLAR